MIVSVSAWIARHRKLLVSVAGAAATVAVQAGWTGNPWVTLAILAATAAGVYRAPNANPPAPAAVTLPRAPGGRGAATGTVRIMPSAGTEGAAVTGVRE